MISVDEAKKIIMDETPLGPPAVSPLEESLGCVLARDQQAPFDFPLFSNSAMDGFALRASDLSSASKDSPVSLPVQGVIKAGDQPPPLEIGKAAKIMTGAMIPPHADTVVQKEIVQEECGSVHFISPARKGANVRFQGEEIKKGESALSRGTSLTPGALGFLSSLGVQEVQVYQKPRVMLLSTGSELVKGREQLQPGKIFESNSKSLRAALQEIPCEIILLPIFADDPELLKKRLQIEIDRFNFLLLSGGVSVGEYDHTKSVLEEIGVRTLFWKVAQKPGKPLYFGRKGRTIVFGLPGNPASALVCFYEYVRPALLKALGFSHAQLKTMKAPLRGSFEKKSGLTHFLKGHFSSNGIGKGVEILEGQGSHMMGSFAKANCLVVLPREGEIFRKGDEVEIHLLPL